MFATDITTDSQTFDGGLPVTLNQKRAGTVNLVSVRNATNGPLSNRQIQALGSLNLVSLSLTGTERSWSLDAADVGPAGVQPGDVIDDGTSRWTVASAALATLGNRWKCVTRKQP